MLNGSLSEEAYCLECRGEPDDKPAVTHGEPQAPDQATTENPTRLPICRLLRLIAFLMALIRVLWFDLRWKTEEVATKKSELEDKMTFLPAAWMVFTNAIMISMWWVAMCLSMRCESWQDFNAIQGPTLQFVRERPIRKPPDKEGRPVGKNKDGQRMFADIIEREQTLGTKKTLFDHVFRCIHLPDPVDDSCYWHCKLRQPSPLHNLTSPSLKTSRYVTVCAGTKETE